MGIEPAVNVTRVLIADDHHLVRRAIRAMLSQSAEFAVVGEAEDGREAISLAQSLQPDIILMDISMPVLSGIQAMEEIHRLKLSARVIILSLHVSSTLVKNALRKGASGYLVKGISSEALLQALRSVARGETYLGPVAQASAE